MKHVIHISRAGIHSDPIDLRKAGRSHKYWKREPYFRNGKRLWRYFYNTPADRERWAKEHDPKGEHDHHVKGGKSAKGEAYDPKKRHLPATASLTGDRIQEIAAGMGSRGSKPDVHISARFEREYKTPFVEAEEAGLAPERNPLQRVAAALDMVPDAVRDLVLLRKIKVTTRKDPAVKKMFEKGNPPRPVPAIYSDRDGQLVLCADSQGRGFNMPAQGDERYGSGLTGTEEMVWREVGRQLRYALAGKRKEAWEEWQALSGKAGRDVKLSPFARQNADHDFMDSFACVMSHPKQLAIQCPERYTFFQKHGLLNLPPIEDMIGRAPGANDWWDGVKTKAKEILAEKMKAEPAGGVPYISDKDEFYQVSSGGRTVYLRMGPNSPEEEDNWETMPDTIDPETGYPVYDKDVAIRFRQKGIVKEVYDEHGRRLNDETAYLFLNQDDESLQKFKGSTHYLGYMMYDGLGSSRGDAEKERKAIRKMEAKGKDPAEKRGSRWEKVPHKIPRAEFMAKTPSYAFGALKLAEKQTAFVFQDGKAVKDPVSGEFLLHAKTYESVNPDGSVARITVKTSPSFQMGDEIQVPVTEHYEDPETGEQLERTRIRPVILDPSTHPDISAAGLAKQYKYPIDELLRRNGRFGQYQIIDPLMSQLINPAGTKIRDASDLHQLLQAAADTQPSIWTTIATSTDVPQSHVHVKVKFDGGGSPLLVGEHWKHKLGLPNPRVSDLISSSGKVKGVEKAKERKPRRRKIKVGGTARVKVGESWIFATVDEKDTSGGKRRYKVTPLPGQGVPEEQMETRQLRSIPTDMDPERPGIMLREFRKPKNDVLLHVDEMRVDSNRDPLAGTGKIKVKLPADGSWNFDTMSRVPGVRVEDGELVLDTSQVDAFREHVGTFILDDEAQSRLDRIKSISKAQVEAGRVGRVPISDVVDPMTGVVNTDGLLKGLKRRLDNGDEFKLGQHQSELLKAMADNDGRIIAAHFMGTGKTVSAIAAVQMMKNLTDENGQPHPNRPKKVAIVVPKNTAMQWVDSVKKFSHSKATLIGSGDLPGSYQMPTTPANWETMPESEKEKWRQEKLGGSSKYWDPSGDDTEYVVISQEYFTQHADELKRVGGFDGMIVDEAHGIQAGAAREVDGRKKGNKRAAKVEDWNPDMKMMMLLTGTPITNRLTKLANYLKIISNGEIDLGTEEEFRDAFLIESAVMKAHGTAKAEKMDLNPQQMSRLQELLKPYMHVATTADVKGKAIPAVSLDENTPTEMSDIQAMLYRGYMDQLTDEEKRKLEMAATLGEDEQSILDPEARRKIAVARNITGTPAYKPKDGRKYITYSVEEEDKKTGKVRKKKEVFRLPGWKDLRKRFGGRFPSSDDVTRGKISQTEFVELVKWTSHALGRDYERLAGRKVKDTLSESDFSRLKAGQPFESGLQFGDRVPNPEYGPEGAQCRGEMAATGEIKPIEHVIRDANGKEVDRIVVPVGARFVRGKNAQYFFGGLPDDHPLAGEFESDWDFNEGDAEATAGPKMQKPKEGRSDKSVLTSPDRRRERAMFDLAMTTGSAKAAALEDYIGQKLDPSLGGNPDGQMIMFGHTYPSVRAMESKLRTMGYKDINEALNSDLEAEGDPIPSNGKYFVTYMGSNETLGDRDLNSEIFRKRKGPRGEDMEMSMFVHRALHGSSEDPVKEGEVGAGWSKSQRDAISKNFPGIEMPSHVTAIDVGGTLEYHYVYESQLSTKERKAIEEMDDQILKAEGAEKKSLIKARDKMLKKHWTDTPPLTKRQVAIFNNCQFMVASDAAQVGLNWGNAQDLVMYDSLFSPMEEWQRITRAARMLPPAVEKKLKPTFAEITRLVAKKGETDGFAEYEGDAAGALSIVNDVLKANPHLAAHIREHSKMNPAAIAETFLAQRAIDRIEGLRATVRQQLETHGRVITDAPKVKDPETGKMVHQRLKAQEITSADVMNEILEKHIKPFEKQVLRSRKYMVDVKRLTTSVRTPEMETVSVTDPETGKKKKVQRPTGRMQVEAVSKAEKSVMMAGRAKQVPTEKMLTLIQSEMPVKPAFDYLPVSANNLTQFSTPEAAQTGMTAAEKAAEEKKKADSKAWYKEQRRKEREKRKRIKEERRAKKKAEKAAKKAAAKKSEPTGHRFFIKRGM